jgi:hypothetical protein
MGRYCLLAKPFFKPGKKRKRSLHMLGELVEGGYALLFIVKKYSC